MYVYICIRAPYVHHLSCQELWAPASMKSAIQIKLDWLIDWLIDMLIPVLERQLQFSPRWFVTPNNNSHDQSQGRAEPLQCYIQILHLFFFFSDKAPVSNWCISNLFVHWHATDRERATLVSRVIWWHEIKKKMHRERKKHTQTNHSHVVLFLQDVTLAVCGVFACCIQ